MFQVDETRAAHTAEHRHVALHLDGCVFTGTIRKSERTTRVICARARVYEFNTSAYVWYDDVFTYGKLPSKLTVIIVRITAGGGVQSTNPAASLN